MRLYLAQHGEAAPEHVDPDRQLTEKGIADVRKISSFLRPFGLTVGSVWHSGKARATQTAEIIAAGIEGPAPVMRSGLAPNDPVSPIQEQIADMLDDLMIVGHLPFLGKLAAVLVTGSESADIVAFQQGGIVCLERDEKSVWKLRWMIIPDLLR